LSLRMINIQRSRKSNSHWLHMHSIPIKPDYF
jgi:hypothetical protein